jgi:hypothetical protein
MSTTVFLAAIALAFALDCITTAYALTHLNAREANPVMRALIDRLGVRAGLAIAKLVIFALLAWQVAHFAGWARALLVGVYVAVVLNNVYQIGRGRRWWV